MQNFSKKQKCLNLGPKMPYLGIYQQKLSYLSIFGLEFEKNVVIFEIRVHKFVWFQSLVRMRPKIA